MSRVLLADDSPHAQRMGERILRDEGFEVVSVTDGETALVRLLDVDPDVIVADAFLPRRSGFDICREVKANPKLRHVRIVLTAGVLEPVDEAEAARAGSDAFLKKPFEASLMLDTLKPLLESARQARDFTASVHHEEEDAALEPLEVDEERVRAAVTIALDTAMPAIIEEITRQVVRALKK
ncbi:MAG: response regulator [Bryobacterales bacterium]|nr:response regulator [Bryobacterales bacterium]